MKSENSPGPKKGKETFGCQGAIKQSRKLELGISDIENIICNTPTEWKENTLMAVILWLLQNKTCKKAQQDVERASIYSEEQNPEYIREQYKDQKRR